MEAFLCYHNDDHTPDEMGRARNGPNESEEKIGKYLVITRLECTAESAKKSH
jgi:hypothetical protein